MQFEPAKVRDLLTGGHGAAADARVQPKWNDLIFLLLFVRRPLPRRHCIDLAQLAQFFGFIALSVISLRGLAQTSTSRSAGLGSRGSSITLDRSTAYLFSIISGMGLLLSLIYLFLVKTFTRACARRSWRMRLTRPGIILEVTLILSVLISIACACYDWPWL
jgi:hypothetical protein